MNLENLKDALDQQKDNQREMIVEMNKNMVMETLNHYIKDLDVSEVRRVRREINNHLNRLVDEKLDKAREEDDSLIALIFKTERR